MVKLNGKGTNGNNVHPKSYSKFSLDDIDQLGIEVQTYPLFPNLVAIAPSNWLVETLEIYPEIDLSSEKAKSEFIIVPVIREIVKRNRNKLKVFSGKDFDVDGTLGLTGFCDFIFSKSAISTRIKAPVFFIVAAKNENLDTGIAQCIASMYAAHLFNGNKKEEP